MWRHLGYVIKYCYPRGWNDSTAGKALALCEADPDRYIASYMVSWTLSGAIPEYRAKNKSWA